MDGLFGPTMRIMRILPERPDERNQWERAHPIRKALEHVSAHSVKFKDVHFTDAQQLFGPHDERNPPRMVTWTGSFRTPEGIHVKVATGGGVSRDAADSRMHAMFTVETPGQPSLEYYVQRPDQPLPSIFHPAEPGTGTVLADVKEEEYRHLASILSCLGPKQLPIPRRLKVAPEDRANRALLRNAAAHDSNCAFAEGFRTDLLAWFKQNAPTD